MKPSRHALVFAIISAIAATCLLPHSISQTAQADDTPGMVFGPETFRREEGKPQTYVRRFNVTNASDRFSLEIINGDPDDKADYDSKKKARSSSADIYLNDVLVASSSDIKKDVRRLSIPVALNEGENTIKLSLKSSPVTMLTIFITRTVITPPKDIIPPQVVSVQPANGAVGVPINGATVRVTFSEPINLDTLSASSFFVTTGGNTLSGKIDVSADATTATFTPATPLAYSTTYTVTVTNAIKDAAGNLLASEFKSVFTTEAAPPPPPPPPDVTPPRVVSISPQAGSLDNQNSVPVVVRFSEPVDPTTVADNVLIFSDTAKGGGTVVIQEGGSFLAVPNGERVDGTVASSADGLSAMFTPTVTLADGTSRRTRLPANAMITVVVLTRVKDLAGNNLDQDPQTSGQQLFNASFTTSAFNLTGSTAVARVNPQAAILQAALLPGDEVLVSGGYDEFDQVNATAEIYNKATGSYRSVPMLEGRAEHSVTVLDDGKVLITGGINQSGQVLSTAEIYDPATGSFTSVGSMHTPRFGHTSTLLPDGSVLITGGYNNAALDTAEIFIPAGHTFPMSNTFVEVPGRMSSARAFHTATSLQDGTVLIAGGASNGAVLNSAEVFKPTPFAPQLGQFLPVGNTMSTPRFRHTATALPNGKVLITGGKDNLLRTLNTAEFYTPASASVLSTFSAAGLMTEPRAFHTAALMSDGSVLIAGGSSGSASASGTAEVFKNGQFTRVRSPLTYSRSSHAVVLLSDGTLLLTNGENGATKLKSAEIYTPRP
ncbi:MAG TPA: kelch repeat-containing protein [Blastocatellia bacterium]|nr:kelch repeat-containing protein [Blastocatellia bacterium]